MQIIKSKVKLKKSGFTLIELLIVIALLGILAVGLLAAIDPLEQFRKGQDTGQRNAVQELYNSYLRYYAVKQSFPQGVSASVGPLAMDNLTIGSDITMMISQGELKTNFVENVRRGDMIFVWYQDDGFNAEHSVCFYPQSKSIRTDPNTKYNAQGVTTASCVSGGSGCYWCLH